MQKTVSEELKTWYFYYSGFWSAGQWGGAIVPRAPPGYATVFTPDVMSIHNVSRLLQFLLSGFTFVSLVHEYW